MSTTSHDVGNAGINVSSASAVITTTGGLMGWVNENAILLGLVFSFISLIVGVVFKVIDNRNVERHRRELLAQEASHNAKMVEALRDEIRQTRSGS